MSLAWMTVSHRRDDWPVVKHTLKSRAIVAWCRVRWYLRKIWKWVAGFVIGFTLGVAVLNLIQAHAAQEFILNFRTVPVIMAPSSDGDSDLLLSYGRPVPGPDKPGGELASMKPESTNRMERPIYREYVITAFMPQILDRKGKKAAKAHLRVALAAIFGPAGGRRRRVTPARLWHRDQGI